ncbi:uncharacterized protein LOC110039068 [Phalaenopsis equestris]|uniref:uncharacterized protein LOC110039068 n=1 Tax=Phalaenopsis equestris TaxID=78828 RepID=UPI0009E58C23|nr:uncharacterized protein LOC110039068 [Phalaenopsis equestris]
MEITRLFAQVIGMWQISNSHYIRAQRSKSPILKPTPPAKSHAFLSPVTCGTVYAAPSTSAFHVLNLPPAVAAESLAISRNNSGDVDANETTKASLPRRLLHRRLRFSSTSSMRAKVPRSGHPSSSSGDGTLHRPPSGARPGAGWISMMTSVRYLAARTAFTIEISLRDCLGYIKSG